MKPSTVLVSLLIAAATFSIALVALPAAAQNASQIAHAQAGGSCPRCNLFQADFSNRELKGRNFAGARLRQANMSAAVMNYTTMAGADLRDVNAYGAVFTGVSFAGANMTNASFVGAYLEGANLRGAILTGVNFSGAEMDRAIGLTQAQLAGACGDRATTLPRGLRIRPCD
jgi:uncharacterized protein YjbI with pentapeptide repeats